MDRQTACHVERRHPPYIARTVVVDTAAVPKESLSHHGTSLSARDGHRGLAVGVDRGKVGAGAYEEEEEERRERS